MKTITDKEFKEMAVLSFRKNPEARCFLARRGKKLWHIEGIIANDDLITENSYITYVPYLNLHHNLFHVKSIEYGDSKGSFDFRHFTAECEFIQVVTPKK